MEAALQKVINKKPWNKLNGKLLVGHYIYITLKGATCYRKANAIKKKKCRFILI